MKHQAQTKNKEHQQHRDFRHYPACRYCTPAAAASRHLACRTVAAHEALMSQQSRQHYSYHYTYEEPLQRGGV